MNKGFWVAKGTVNDGDATFDNPSKIEPKRSHYWFANGGESELFPNKKQAIQAAHNKPSAEASNLNVPCWESTSTFSTVPTQFIGRLFDPDCTRLACFAERNLSPAGTDSIRRKGTEDPFGEEASVRLSITHAVEDPEASCFNYGGYRKVKVNHVTDLNGSMHAPSKHSLDGVNNDLSTGPTYTEQHQSSYMPMAQGFNKEDDTVTLMGHACNQGESHVRSSHNTYCKGEDGAISLSDTYTKEDTGLVSFVRFHNEHEIIPVGQPLSSYDSHSKPSVQTGTASDKQLNMSNNASPQVAKSKHQSLCKKLEVKISKKEAPNSFPSNVRSLISTGMLDGLPVKYVSLSRKELRGVIKGSGYLCGCQSCNFSKVLNAYEFECHAGCKTKHPNNHIYFDNGKSIYQIVQELRSTPESLLFDTIQTAFEAPINQKSFKSWKESYQAATRELERIYGREELNL